MNIREADYLGPELTSAHLHFEEAYRKMLKAAEDLQNEGQQVYFSNQGRDGRKYFVKFDGNTSVDFR